MHFFPSLQLVPLAFGVTTHCPVDDLQTELRQSSPVHTLLLPPLHAPAPSQVSAKVQPSPSLQLVPEALGVVPQWPDVVSHTPTAHSVPTQTLADPALQLLSLPQVSAKVHGSPSLHAAPVFAACLHVPAAQLSTVQLLPSSQFFCVPAQPPAEVQRSLNVQATPSSHVAPVCTAWLQAPDVVVQLSTVQVSLSSQLFSAPAHTPFAQLSLTVQGLLSSQVLLLAPKTH